MPEKNTLADRFASKTKIASNGCLLWTGAKDGGGYGMLRVSRGLVKRAHIVAWFLATGEWPPAGQVVRHTCDTPACVLHAHHLLGTKADNNRDRDERGRHITHSRGGKRTIPAATVQAIRDLQGVVTQRTIAACFGISPGYVSTLQTKKNRRAD